MISIFFLFSLFVAPTLFFSIIVVADVVDVVNVVVVVVDVAIINVVGPALNVAADRN